MIQHIITEVCPDKDLAEMKTPSRRFLKCQAPTFTAEIKRMRWESLPIIGQGETAMASTSDEARPRSHSIRRLDGRS